MDGIYLAIIVGFFAVTWGLALLSDRLAGGPVAGQEESR